MNSEREPHDAALAALLREHASETPPAHIDAAVRAAAHREVERASTERAARVNARAAQAWHWWMPLAAAAVIGVIVIGVLPLAPSIVDDAAQRASDMPAESIRPPAQMRSAPAPRQAAKTAASSPAAPPVQRKEQHAAGGLPAPPVIARKPADSATRQSSAPAPAPPPPLAAIAPSGPDTPAGADAAPEVGGATNRVQGADAGVPTAERSKATTAPAVPDVYARSLADWIARIRGLLTAGDAEEALRELRRYRAAFEDADARLPPDLAEWARSQR